MKPSQSYIRRQKIASKYFPIVVTIIAIVLLSIILITAFSVESKTPISYEDANKILNDLGYTTVDITDEYVDDYPLINGAIGFNQNNIQFYYIDMYNNKDANVAYAYCCSYLNEHKNPYNHSAGYKNYRYYDTHNDGLYMIVLNVDNIVIFATAPESEMNNVQKIIVSLGYWDKTEY